MEKSTLGLLTKRPEITLSGQKVKILVKTRKGEIGTYIKPEGTMIGLLHRIEFANGDAGLYGLNDFKKIN